MWLSESLNSLAQAQWLIMKEHVPGICNPAKFKFCSKLLYIVLYVSHVIMAQKSPYASDNSFRMSAQWITCKWIKNIWAKFILKYRTWPNVFWVLNETKFWERASKTPKQSQTLFFVYINAKGLTQLQCCLVIKTPAPRNSGRPSWDPAPPRPASNQLPDHSMNYPRIMQKNHMG